MNIEDREGYVKKSFLGKITSFSHLKSFVEYRIVRKIKLKFIKPRDYCFPSSIIHLNDFYIHKNWEYLRRGYEDELQLKKYIWELKSYSMCTYDAFLNIAHAVKYIENNNIEGVFVEMGTWKGGSAGMMAAANMLYGDKPRQLHLFDSFKGLPEPNWEHDDKIFMENEFKISIENQKGRLSPINALVADKKDVVEVMNKVVSYPMEFVHIHEGWFQETLPIVIEEIDSIAMLRLDGDLFDSTMVCLQYLFDKVRSGGVVIIDDWCLDGCRKACEEFFKVKGINPFIHYADVCVRYFIKN